MVAPISMPLAVTSAAAAPSSVEYLSIQSATDNTCYGIAQCAKALVGRGLADSIATYCTDDELHIISTCISYGVMSWWVASLIVIP